MDDEVEESQVLRQLLLQGHAIDDDLDDEMDSASELSSQQSAVESQATDVAAAATETSTSTTWSCSRCTYENTVSSSICEICGSPREVIDVTSSGASSSTSTVATSDGRWECAACTLLNPRQVHVCTVCSTPNPAAMGAARSQRGFGVGSALGLFERVDREAPSQVGISSAALESLANDKNGGIQLVDALQTMTHNLAMMEASSEGGLGLLMGRPKVSTKNDPNLITVLSAILANASKFDFQPRLLACQSLNYLIKMDIRMSDGKKAQEYMTTYLGVMDEIAVKHDGGRAESLSALSTEKHLAEEATNGLEVACQSHPVAFRELCQPDPLTKLLRFLMFANSLHVNVLLTSLSLLQKVCQKVHFHTKTPPPSSKRKAHQHSPDKATAPPTVLSTIMTALQTYIDHANPRVQVGAIKCITILYHRTPLHDHLSKECIRQMLHIAVAPSTEDTYDASRASVALLSELVDESSTVLTTLLDPGVVEPLLQQLAPMLQTEAVATSTLRFLSKVTGRIGHQAGGESKASTVLHRLLVAFIKANAVSTVSALLKDGANLHKTSPVSPFVVAVTDSSIAMVRLLIRKGAHVSVEALHAAALAERCDVVSLLLQHGASPNAANEHGETLHQVLAKHPSTHPVAKLLAIHDHARFDMHAMDHDHDHGECGGHHHAPRRLHHAHSDQAVAAAADGASDELTPPPPTLDGTARREVLLSEFAREWNDMDTEEDESEHFDDDDMHSDDDDDEFHDMYHDDDESHEEDDEEDDDVDDGDEEDGKQEDAMPAASHHDNEETKHDHAVEASGGDVPPVNVRREDAVAFTHALFTSLVRAVPAVDNKQVTYAVLSTMANVLIYPIELTDGDINVLLEVIHGLLMESNDTPAKTEDHGGHHDTDLNVYAMVLALRLLEALSTVNNGQTVVGQMERQGILDRMRSFAAQTHASPVDATVASLVTDWLDTLAPMASSTSIESNPVVARLNSLCDGLAAASDAAAISLVLDDILTCIDAGVTTYELTQSAVVPTLLHALCRHKVSWNPKLPALVRHLHQVVGLHESLPTMSYAMAKGKEFYPLTRQLRCRMRLLPSGHHGDAAAAASRSIHASPLTLFSSFERTVFRCAPISDPKWFMYAWSLVGQSIWKPVDGKWVEATVCGFDPSTGCHLLHFRDEFVEEVLQEEAYRLVKSPLKVYSSVSMDLSSFGTTSPLKRRTPDDNSSPMRRSKRIKRRASDEAAASRDDDAAPSSEERSQPSEVRSREKRLMDVLRLQESSAPAEGDKVWVSNGSNICVCGTYTRKTSSQQVEVEVSFGSQVKVPLVVDEANLVQFQAKARPGSASSKVQRMLSALDSQGRSGGGGRPVLEHLRRLLARSRPDHVNADDSPSGTAAAAASSGAPSGTRRGKQKAAKPSPPSIQYEDEQFTITAPPVVRVLLGYGDYSDKSEDQLHWLTADGDHLNDKAIPVARWLFHVFADGQKPKAKPETLDVPSPRQVSWPLAVFGTFCKELKLGFMSSEEWMAFSRHSTVDGDKDVVTWTGFSAFVVALCKESRHMRCLWQYLEHLGFKTSAFQPAPTVPSHLVEFAPDDNLFYCLHKIHPTQSLGLLPWKCVFNVFCDFAVRWTKDGASTSAKLAAVDVPMTDDDEATHGSVAFTQSVGLLRVMHDYFGGELTKDTWLNPRLSRKLRMQLQDVLSVTSGTYPSWCDELVQQSKFFFPLDMRYTLFRTTAFGFSRSLHWFRDHLDHDSNNDELSISPLPKERAKVDRVDIVKSAEAVMKVHAKRKAILDIVFVGERGYGSGVTAAFYSAVANALQCNKALRMWVGGHEDSTDDVIRHPNGLFPLPVLDATDALKDRFRLMGRLAGKALQDERLLPLPLSSHFLNLVFGHAVPVDQLATIFLEPGRILLDLNTAAQALRTGRQDVKIDNMPAHEWLAAVDLNFVDPITQAELESNGSAKSVTVDNLHAYVDLVLRSWLDRGVAAQVQAFQEGLSEVVALKKLQLLFVDELQLTLCGTVDVEWTKESLRQTIKLAHGYTSASEPIEHLIDVLVDMTTAQRRAFLLYATGCPNLPPGGVGFEKLKPQFEVVRRVSPDGDPVDKTLPFARTCTNTLHLPAYSSKAILAQQLEYAVLNSKGVIDRD